MVSPLAPRQGRSPGGSPLGGSEPKLLFLLWYRETEASLSLGRLQMPKHPDPPGRPWTEILGPAGFAAPEPEGSVLPDLSGAEAPFLPVAAREPKSRFPPGWS